MEVPLFLFQVGFAVLIIAIGFLAGTAVERRHYRSIEERERGLRGIPASTLRELPDPERILRSRLVTGSVVISIDAFKRALAELQGFFGGEVTAYETLVDRARREAMLRLYDHVGPPEILTNVRLETSPIGGRSNERVASIEVLAYATAVELRP